MVLFLSEVFNPRSSYVCRICEEEVTWEEREWHSHSPFLHVMKLNMDFFDAVARILRPIANFCLRAENMVPKNKAPEEEDGGLIADKTDLKIAAAMVVGAVAWEMVIKRLFLGRGRGGGGGEDGNGVSRGVDGNGVSRGVDGNGVSRGVDDDGVGLGVDDDGGGEI